MSWKPPVTTSKLLALRVTKVWPVSEPVIKVLPRGTAGLAQPVPLRSTPPVSVSVTPGANSQVFEVVLTRFPVENWRKQLQHVRTTPLFRGVLSPVIVLTSSPDPDSGPPVTG